MAIQKVGVVGFGQMGSGIAQVCAMAGLDVLAREIDQKFIDGGMKRIDGSLARVVKSGRMSEDDAKSARGRVRGTTSLAEFADRDLVIEAVAEDEVVKSWEARPVPGSAGSPRSRRIGIAWTVRAEAATARRPPRRATRSTCAWRS